MNKYQTLMKRKAAQCRGRTTKQSVRKAANDYVRDRQKKGETKAQAQKKANKILNKPCPKFAVGKKIGQRGGSRRTRRVRGKAKK